MRDRGESLRDICSTLGIGGTQEQAGIELAANGRQASTRFEWTRSHDIAKTMRANRKTVYRHLASPTPTCYGAVPIDTQIGPKGRQTSCSSS